MSGGYMGKFLWVDLSKGKLKDEALDEKLCREFIGGYGIGARIIYSRQRAGVDPLGPENILGYMTGPFTGTDAPLSARFAVVVGKSPLTGGWGDSNSGGDFGPYMKFAGYDGVFFTGVSQKPVYLFIKDGKAELRDASDLWGKDTYETEDMLKNELGKEVRVSAIGPAGEKLSLIASITSKGGRANGRSGVGAVMGSKKLKAVVVTGKAKISVANAEKLKEARRKYTAIINKQMKGCAFDGGNMGTAGTVAPAALGRFSTGGGGPVKNWTGVGVVDFPKAYNIAGEKVMEKLERKVSCYRCTIGCGGYMKAGTEYEYVTGTKKPEYETSAAFGTMCLNDNLESIIKANDICNRYGLDTISTGATIAFAIECYENGLITKEDTGGIELTWGNHKAIVAMTEKVAKREGFGAVLADGSKVGAEKIGKGADRYAVHVHGQEPAMWDPKFLPSVGCSYQSDPTPGRHTQGGLFHFEMGLGPPGFEPSLDKYTYTGKGKFEATLRNHIQLINATGMCLMASIYLPLDVVPTCLPLVTGWEVSPEEVDRTGQRISAMRQAFNLREGLTPEDFRLPGRMVGNPPLKEGPVANRVVDVDTLVREYYKELDWDPETGKPSKKRLLELGLDDVAKDLWPKK
jgi:aldehyde:ferredoxin oxidoreductase